MITCCKWIITMIKKYALNFTFFFIFILIGASPLLGQSILEKKANLKSFEGDMDQEMEQFLFQINQEIHDIQLAIQDLYSQVYHLYSQEAPSENYHSILLQINTNRKYLSDLQSRWRELAIKGNQIEGYGLWHAPDTTMEQLIIDYGSQDYVYLIPPEVSAMKLGINSNLPIPRASWSQMLDLILSQNGVGIRTLNPYLKQLYLLNQDRSHVCHITNDKCELEFFPPEARVCYVLSPEPSEVRRTYAFLEKFINPVTTHLHLLGRDILIVGQSSSLQDLLKMSDFVSANRGKKEFRIIPVNKIRAEEMARILESMFDQDRSPEMISEGKKEAVAQKVNAEPNGMKIVILENEAQALFISGSVEEIRKAEELIYNVEEQIGGAREKVVYWYTVKNSDAAELADVLFRVYLLMASNGIGPDDGSRNPGLNGDNPNLVPLLVPPPSQKEPPSSLYGQEGYYQEGGYVVNPAPAEPGAFFETNPNEGRNNFIVDAKTGSIVMVIEADILPKMKDLLKRLDVPKKMVQIETLLFEKVLTRDNTMGLNVLKFGEHIAKNHNLAGAAFNNICPGHDHFLPQNKGVFEFFLSHKGKSGMAPFDLIYRFLLAQDDVQINSNPSIMTMNQTPATISINEDISINTGIFEVETAKGVTLKDAFTRAQYGITISIKPTIHLSGCDEDDEKEGDFVTMETDITFDTIHPGSHNNRPDVTRRHITNHVSIPDGETVVIGGLRKKITHDSREAIPFLGELPGLGKLFGINCQKDYSTEMFIFITPRIVKDPKEQLRCLRQELLCIRPGDVPYFLECVQEAHQFEKTRLLEGTMSLMFGRPRDQYYMLDSYTSGCDYDGR